MKPAAFLFDLDGTLLDTEALWTEAIVEWLADRGAKTTVGEVAPLVFGHSWLDIQATLHEKFPMLPKTAPEEDAKTLRPYYARRAVNPESQVIPGAVSFLKKVSRIAPCVVVSGSPHEDVVQAGRTAGMRVIGVDRNKHVQQDFAGCEWLVHDLSELDVSVVFGEADER